MTYALHKLIAFVFLGGIFWYVFHDLDRVRDDAFQLSIGVLMLAFAFFFLFIPPIVIRLRGRDRRRRNQAAFDAWRAEVGETGPAPYAHVKGLVVLDPDERAYFIDKITLYVRPGAGYDDVSVPGAPGEVAFPRLGRTWRKIQRVRVAVTDRRLLLVGKAVRFSLPLADLADVTAAVGGVVISTAEGRAHLAFTVPNPLVVTEIIRRLRSRKGAFDS